MLICARLKTNWKLELLKRPKRSSVRILSEAPYSFLVKGQFPTDVVVRIAKAGTISGARLGGQQSLTLRSLQQIDATNLHRLERRD